MRLLFVIGVKLVGDGDVEQSENDGLKQDAPSKSRVIIENHIEQPHHNAVDDRCDNYLNDK